MLVEESEDTEQKQQVLNDALRQLNEMMIDIVTQTIEYIETPETRVTESEFIKEFLVGCDIKTNKSIKEYSAELRSKNETKPLKMTCIHCKHEYKQQLVLNFTDFFE
jgi:hypothetical protein